MESFAPDFSRHWLAEHGDDSTFARSPFADDELVSPSQKEALEALAERVNAARSIV